MFFSQDMHLTWDAQPHAIHVKEQSQDDTLDVLIALV